MNRRILLLASLLPLFALAAGVVFGLDRVALLDPLAAGSPLPLPTEHRLDDGAEARQKKARKEWMAYVHKSAPGTDWKAIERENGLREMERRSALLAAAGGAGASRWSEVGSQNLAGRMHCAVIGPSGDVLYGGSALGGVWRGTLEGTGWTPLSDNLFGGAHEVAVVPSDVEGEPDVLVATTDAGALHASRDDGATWSAPPGVAGLVRVRGVAVLHDAAMTILVHGRVSGGGTPSVILASTDRGRTFSTRWQGAGFDGWMWVPRTGPDAATDVYLLHEGRLRRSGDGGFTFPFETVIDAAATRAVLAGSEAGLPALYAAIQSGGAWRLHRSTDGGASFAFVHAISDFWESLCASNVDPDLVLYGGVEARRSTDGGETFAKVNNWGDYYGDPVRKLHADIPGIHAWPDPTVAFGERWFVATDGGLYESKDGVATVRNLSLEGLGVSQYYSTLTSRSNPNLILAGSQDQGYQRGVFRPSSGPGPSTPFTQLISGDYGHLTSSDGTFGLVYSTYPGFVLVSEGDDARIWYPFVDFPPGARSAWLPPVVADPLDPASFFFCGDFLHRYTRVSGPTWNRVQHSTRDFKIGGGNYVSALAFAPSDPRRVYACNDTGWIFRSTDRGVTWAVSATAPAGQYFYGNAIDVHPTNALEAVIGGSGYSGPGVVRTTDGGQTWSPLTAGLPATLVYALVYAEDGSGDVYAGTETGPYRFDRAAGRWETIAEPGTPITIHWSAESVNGGTAIRFGTYGRGIWDYAIPIPPELSCRYGTVDLGRSAAPAKLLTVNGSSGDSLRREVLVGIRQPITVACARPPGGPVFADYVTWVWAADVVNPSDAYVGPTLVGCTVNPSPLVVGALPKAFRCLRGGFGAEYCGATREIGGAPASVPFTVARARGFGRAITLSIQGLVEDQGAANAAGVSVMNAVIVRIE